MILMKVTLGLQLKKSKAKKSGKKAGSAYMDHVASRDMNSRPYVHKPLAKKEPKYVRFLDMDVPYKQFHLVKNSLIVMLAILFFALFMNFVAKPRLSEVGQNYSDQFSKFRKYFGEQRQEFERKRIQSGKSENLMGDDSDEE